MMQLGSSGGVETTGYLGAISAIGSGVSTGNPVEGFLLDKSHLASYLLNGTYELALLDAATNLWAGHGIIARSENTETFASASSKALSGECTTLRITSLTGVDAFDGGKVNVQYDNNGQTALVVPPGTVVQVQNFQSGTPAGGSVLIPFDDTIPQITEGWAWNTLSFTPKYASSKLRIQTTLYCTGDAASGNVLMAPIFRDGAADAIQTSVKHMQVNSFEILSSDFTVDALTTNSQDFMVRVGQNLAGSSYVNAINGFGRMGGTAISSITITEIAQ
jgi:hypothetical protein